MAGAFDKLARPVQKWIRQQGWQELRDIQVRATHDVMGSGADLIIAASTAGGKTEAVFLPLISQVLDAQEPSVGFDLLYIGPLKALITDQAERLENICRDTDLPVVPWHGDVPQPTKARALKAPRGILLITPESLEALFVRRGAAISRLFGATRAVVIDELHSMLHTERGVQMRSLLSRMELAVKRPIRRIGLSATLGDMALARSYLRSDAADAVRLIEAEGGEAELRLQLRGYVSGGEADLEPAAEQRVATHLFETLRGSDNLVFAGARGSVEVYADRLRRLCEDAHLPQEFYAHHASLSREHRDFVEKRLKDAAKPTTAVCTSTLELGIDIGDVACVTQIGAPFSVASLRQRLGRSGRRAGQPAVLRQYNVEARLSSASSFVDRLRLGLIRSIAMIELLLEGWCEPPKPQALHLSTLVHQTLSVIAQRGGASADTIYTTLCLKGAFRQIGVSDFASVLRCLGDRDVELIEQTERGLLLLGRVGEKIVENYRFFAVFETPEEYRLVANGRELGAIPVDNILSPGMMVIFSGRRWLVQEVDDQAKVISVAPAEGGAPPIFGGGPGDIHDRVIERMFDLLEGEKRPVYMDQMALELLEDARAEYRLMGFETAPIVELGERTFAVATRTGTVKTNTLSLALRAFDFRVEQHDGFLLTVTPNKGPALHSVLRRIADGEEVELFAEATNLRFEKYHRYLSDDLLIKDACSSKLDISALRQMCSRLCAALGDDL